MALPALLGAGAKAIGGSMVKAGGKAVASKVLGRKKGTQPGRIIPGAGGKGGGGRGGGGRGGAIVPRTKMVSPKEMKSLKVGDPVSPGKDPLKSIYGNVILIEKILKGTYASEKDQLRKQRQDDKKADKSAQEKKLETKSPKIDRKKGEIKKLPKTGIFDWITNFIGNILMGYFAVRLIKYLPQLMGMLKGLGKVIEFVTDVGMFLVDGLASFINFSYNVYDGTRNIMKGIGLDGAFDAVMKAMEVAITVLTFALGARSLGGFGGGGRGGRSGGRTGISGRSAGRTRTTSSQAARRYAQRFGRNAATRRFGEQGVRSLGGKYARSSATNLARRATVGVLGRGGTKAALKIVAPLVRRVPVIGGVLEFALSLLAGEPVGKAAFRAIGSGLGTWIGGALGSLIPIPFVGTAIGAFVGGAGGSELAGVMYDAFFGGKEKQPDSPKEPEAKRRGGQVSRGFQQTTLEQQEEAITKKPSFEKIKAPEGGKIKTGKNTDQAWWDFLGWAGTGGQDEMMDLGPGGQLLANRVVKVGNSFGEHPFFGPILSLAAKIILGQTPNDREYKNVGYGLNMMIRAGIAGGKIGEGIKGYADGGMVRTMGGVNIGRWATDSFKKELSNTLYKNFDATKSSDSSSGANNVTSEVATMPPSTSYVPGAGPELGSSTAPTVAESAHAGYKRIYNLAKQAGDPFPEVTAAQWAIESGYGSSKTGKNNPFGQTGTHPTYGGTTLSTPRDPGGGSKTFMNFGSEAEAVAFRVKRWVPEYGNATTPYEALMNIQKHGGNMRYAQGFPTAQYPQGDWMGYVRSVSRVMTENGMDPHRKATFESTPSSSQTASVAEASSTQKAMNFLGFDETSESEKSGEQITSTGTSGAGMYTGPAGQIGAGAAYHIDTKFHSSIGMSGMISAMDKMADAYASRGREMVFSGQGYSRLKAYKSDLEAGEKQKLLRSAIDAHSHSTFMRAQGFLPFDYYNPSIAANKDLYHPSTEGAEILLPDFGGTKKVGSLYGGYGRSADIYDSSGKHVAMTGHGDLRRSHAGTKLSGREQMLKILPGQSLLDENTSKSLGAATLARLNAASTPEEIRKIAGQIAGVSGYASYEQGAEQTVVVVDPPQQMSEESPQSSDGGMMSIGGSSHDPFEFLDYQG